MSDNVLKQATSAIQENWKQVSKGDIKKARGNLESLAKTIVEKSGDSAEVVRERLQGIVDDVASRRKKKKSFLGRIGGFFIGLFKLTVALAAIGAAAAAGLMFWRKRMEKTSAEEYGRPAEPAAVDESGSIPAAGADAGPTPPGGS
ncbi:MAG: hypothetical protein GEU28_10785 [Dehalococcoidia bacterium]|nr:hypothetical protein [Dehalococcoidia bacterium]